MSSGQSVVQHRGQDPSYSSMLQYVYIAGAAMHGDTGVSIKNIVQPGSVAADHDPGDPRSGAKLAQRLLG
jgi:hypothetical protein